MSHVPAGLFNDSDDLELARKIVRKLGNKKRDSGNPVSIGTLMSWLQKATTRGRVEDILRILINDNRTPVKGDVDQDRIYLSKDYFLNPGVSKYGI